MKYKFILFSPWLLKSPVEDQIFLNDVGFRVKVYIVLGFRIQGHLGGFGTAVKGPAPTPGPREKKKHTKS